MREISFLKFSAASVHRNSSKGGLLKKVGKATRSKTKKKKEKEKKKHTKKEDKSNK